MNLAGLPEYSLAPQLIAKYYKAPILGAFLCQRQGVRGSRHSEIIPDPIVYCFSQVQHNKRPYLSRLNHAQTYQSISVAVAICFHSGRGGRYIEF